MSYRTVMDLLEAGQSEEERICRELAKQVQQQKFDPTKLADAFKSAGEALTNFGEALDKHPLWIGSIGLDSKLNDFFKLLMADNFEDVVRVMHEPERTQLADLRKAFLQRRWEDIQNQSPSKGKRRAIIFDL